VREWEESGEEEHKLLGVGGCRLLREVLHCAESTAVELKYRKGISDGDPSKGAQLEDNMCNENQ